MKIVVDIKEDDFKKITQVGDDTINFGLLLELRKAIKIGTPLPKGHGRLIDEDKVRDLLYEQEYNYYTELDKVCDTIAEAPTIIEADEVNHVDIR